MAVDTSMEWAGVGAAAMGVVTTALLRLQSWMNSRKDADSKKGVPEESSQHDDHDVQVMHVGGNGKVTREKVQEMIDKHESSCARVIEAKFDEVLHGLAEAKEQQERVWNSIERHVNSLAEVKADTIAQTARLDDHLSWHRNTRR